MSGTGEITILPTPVKSESDKKDYRVIQLPNGLKALLISDTSYDLEKLDEEEAQVGPDEADGEEEEESGSEDGEDAMDENEGSDDDDDNSERPSKPGPKESGLKESAAGLCIGMGSFSDPEELPGLAHFLEHMVFMGSTKYPSENAFDKFIQKHGGFDNAHTDCENTTFYFEVQRKYLSSALDMFAQFFIQPLMSQNAMEREREAVDSEFQMALTSDYNRKYQIFTSLAKKSHPMAKFMWGNSESLKLGGLSDEEVHKKLHDFKNRHYTAQSMTLTIQSQETLDALQKMVLDCFSSVPNNGLSRESFKDFQKPFETPDYHKIYRITPMKNVYSLEMMWSLPPLMDKYRSKPLTYLGWIIGHEGQGSLIQYLRQKVWALSLTAGNDEDGMEMNETHSIFTITLKLTQLGFESINEVNKVIFAYLKMLQKQGSNERIFVELQKIDDLSFKYMEEKQPMDNVENLCENMQIYPPELILNGEEIMFDYDPGLIDECASHLRTDNVCIFLTAREFAENCDKVEPWFKTKYQVDSIPDDWKLSWNSVQDIPEMFLPMPNQFIAQDLSLKPDLDDKTSANKKFPEKLKSSKFGELFFKKDDIFMKPRAMIAIHVIVPVVRDNLDNAVCLDIFLNCLIQQMTVDTYPAELAELRFSVSATEKGILINLSGFNDKLSLLLETVLKHFETFEDNFQLDMFEAVKQQTKKSYYNYFINPDKLVKELRLSLMQDVFRTAREKHCIISGITADHIKTFNKLMFQKPVFIQTLVQGNMTSDEATKVFDTTLEIFNKGKADDSMEVPETKINKIPDLGGTKILRVEGFNPKDANTLITNYYQFGPGSLLEHMYLEVGQELMEEPVFDRLRTKEQLGYSVFCMLRNTFGILGLSITVNTQATKFSVDHVDTRIESFLEWFVNDKLAKITDEDFNDVIRTLIKQKSQADVTLSQEFCRNWAEIQSREYLFDRHLSDCKLLENCDKAAMIDFSTKLIDSKNVLRRKLSVQVVGNANVDEDALEDKPNDAIYDIQYKVDKERSNSNTELFIEDCTAYKATLTSYPVHKIIT